MGGLFSSHDSSDVQTAVNNRARTRDNKYEREEREHRDRQRDAEYQKEKNIARQKSEEHRKMLKAGELNRERQRIRKEKEKEERENNLLKGVADSRSTLTDDTETSAKHQGDIETPVRGQQKLVNNRDDHEINTSRDIISKQGTQSTGKVAVHSAGPRKKPKELNLQEREIIQDRPQVQRGKGHHTVPKKKEKNISHDIRENSPRVVHTKTTHSLAPKQPDILEHQKTSPQDNQSQESRQNSSREHKQTTHSMAPSQSTST